jgi:frataxin-like iron-binding protein CyaY
MNAALKAKLAFIEEKYDIKSNVMQLKTDDFKQLVVSNELVSDI